MPGQPRGMANKLTALEDDLFEIIARFEKMIPEMYRHKGGNGDAAGLW